MHYLSSYSTAHYTLWYWAHQHKLVLKLSTSTTWILCQFHDRTNIGSNQPYKIQWVERSNHLILTNLESQTWKWFQLFLTNFESLGCVDGWMGCAAAPKKKSWLENKKTPHWSGESFLNIWIMLRGLFCYLGLSASHCNVVGRLGMFERRVLSMILDYYCQSSCLMSYFGQDLKAIAVIDWAINETESLVLIESKCFM